MPEREKAIALLENCILGICENCPYNQSEKTQGCRDELMMRVRSLLKEEMDMIEKTQKYIEIVAAMLIAAGMKEEGEHNGADPV